MIDDDEVHKYINEALRSVTAKGLLSPDLMSRTTTSLRRRRGSIRGWLDRYRTYRRFKPMFSPILPVTTNRQLELLLDGAADLDKPLGGRGRMALDFERVHTFGAVHRVVESNFHMAATEQLANVWDNRSPFCLYLRSFNLGARSEFLTGPSGSVQLTQVRFDDHRLQATLCSALHSIPVFGLRNPAHDAGDDVVHRLTVVDDLWPWIVARLIQAAAVIVLCGEDISEGIDVELELLRRARRQDETIIVTNREFTAPEDFRLSLSMDEVTNMSLTPLLKLAISKERGNFDGEPPLLYPPVPPRKMARAGWRIGQRWLRDAKKMTEAGRHQEAQDALTGAQCMFYWGDHKWARCQTYIWLFFAHYVVDGSRHHALTYLEYALDIAEQMIPIAPELWPDFIKSIGPLDRIPDAALASAVSRIRELTPGLDRS